jgi:hypothetical protein
VDRDSRWRKATSRRTGSSALFKNAIADETRKLAIRLTVFGGY